MTQRSRSGHRRLRGTLPPQRPKRPRKQRPTRVYYTTQTPSDHHAKVPDATGQVDFFTKPVITKTGVRQAFVLAFLHVRSRRVICSPATFHPDDAWMRTQAESMLQQAEAADLPIKHLVRDKDFKYREAFDGVFEAADVAVQPTAPRAPNQNAFIERWVGSVKGECLNRFFAFGLRHLDYLVEEYVRFYNERRPHSRMENKPLVGVWSDVDDPPAGLQAITCDERLAGVLRHYERAAA